MLKKGLNFLLLLLIFPVAVFALENDEQDYNVVSEVTKYYKTIEYVNNNKSMMTYSNNSDITKTYEISKEEFDSFDPNAVSTLGSATVRTTYKSMTTSISSNGSYYRYKNVLSWRNIPKVRSYDIIGIGFYKTVKVKSDLHFKQDYCYNSGGCSSSTTNYPQTFTTGAGTTFKIPTGDLSSLTQTFYFDVDKNTTATLTSQEAYGDYSHATSTISLTNAKKYVVNSTGISLNSGVTSYYDTINKATATWTGKW